MIKFVVSCNHKVEAYRLDKETVEVRQDRLDNRYYWSHPKYGCSKSYATPTDAINGMLIDHACYGIKIEECKPLTNAQLQKRWRDKRNALAKIGEETKRDQHIRDLERQIEELKEIVAGLTKIENKL